MVTVQDRYGHLFPSTEQRLNDRLDALYTAALDEAATTGQVINLRR